MKRFITIIISILLSSFVLSAQNVSDLIISEIMVGNENSVTDDYGNHSDWVEIMNKSQGMVNMAGVYLTDDLNDIKKSQILKGDNITKVGPRQTVLLFATGDRRQGTFYLDFKLKKGSTLYLISNDGRTIVDSLEIPEDLPSGMSVGKFALDNKEMDFSTINVGAPSPRMVNGKGDQISRADTMAETDPHGFTLSIVSVSVVFSALIILFLIYSFTGNLFSGKYKEKNEQRKKNKKSKAVSAKAGAEDEIAAAIAMALDREMGSDAYAAIGLALHLYLNDNAHDAESFILTIKSSEHSDWQNKKLNFRKLPR